MKKYKETTRSELFLSMASWSIFILVYWIAFYELDTLCKFGRVNNNITVLSGCMLLFLAWFITLIIRSIKKTSVKSHQSIYKNEAYSSWKAKWTCVSIIITVVITGFYGVKIYHSAINYNGKLSWILSDLKNKRTVKLEHNNIYINGIEGIFTDINKKIHMPQKLYIVNGFKLNFDSHGKITSFDTYLYGKNAKGELQSYLISYSSNKSEDITIYLNGEVNAHYSNNKLLEPLIKTMKVIPLKKTVSNWHEKQYGILYYGKRNFGYNSKGIVYINSKGNIKLLGNVSSEIIGYTVSVFVLDKEDIYTPVRYNLIDGLDNIKAAKSSKENKDKETSKKSNSKDKFYLSKLVGYRLEVSAAAAGRRAYSLEKTIDNGVTWKTINEDPFLGRLGTASGITFLNNKIGFLCLATSGDSEGQLYRTGDGGLSYKKVNFLAAKEQLNNGESCSPFNLPGMPYEKDGILNVLIGQGSDENYNGGCKDLYQSKDKGITWRYIKEVTKD